MSLSRASRLSSQLPFPRGLLTAVYRISRHGDSPASLSRDVIDVPTSATGRNLVVKWLAAGVDPVDLAVVRGEPAAAAFLPAILPAVPGTEGVAVVEKVGPDVTSVKNGDYVIPVKTSVGTWCEAGVISESQVISVPRTLRMELAATLSASPFTALRLLSDFGSLSRGDVVVQNNACSPVGTALVQIAHSMGLRTVSLVDESSGDFAPTVERLKLMGGDVVIGESFAGSDWLQTVLSDMPNPKLGVNGSNSRSCVVVADLIGEGGTVVTHCPGVSNVSAIKSRGLSHASFSLPSWLEDTSRADVEDMVSKLTAMMEEGKLTAWLQTVRFEDLLHAVNEGGITRRKLIALMSVAETI